MHAHQYTVVVSTLPSGGTYSRYGHAAFVLHERGYYPTKIDSRPNAVIAIQDRTGPLPWGMTDRSRGVRTFASMREEEDDLNATLARQEHEWHRTEGS